MRKMFALPVGLYLLFGALMSALAPFLLYPFSNRPFSHAAFEMVDVSTSDATILPVGLHDAGEGRPTVLVFVGNGGSRSYFHALYEPLIQSRVTVIAMPYRGAEGIDGRPTEERLRRDAEDVAAAIPSLLGRDPGPIHLAGYSLGSGLAMGLSAKSGTGQVMLISPYARLCEVMTQKSFLPACLLPWIEHWDSIRFVTAAESDVTILHGQNDTLIPISQSEALSEALERRGRLDRFVRLATTNHNDILFREETQVELQRWAESLGKQEATLQDPASADVPQYRPISSN